MNLQGRNLTPHMQGDDVALLQAELRQLGFAIASTEQAAKTFGAGTEQAVRAFQEQQRLAVTGVVDATTAARISH